MRAQMDIVKKHIDEHTYLRKLTSKEEALSSFIGDYGWLIRELYCTRICEKCEECEIADKLKDNGDLLRHHVK